MKLIFCQTEIAEAIKPLPESKEEISETMNKQKLFSPSVIHNNRHATSLREIFLGDRIWNLVKPKSLIVSPPFGLSSCGTEKKKIPCCFLIICTVSVWTRAIELHVQDFISIRKVENCWRWRMLNAWQTGNYSSLRFRVFESVCWMQ